MHVQKLGYCLSHVFSIWFSLDNFFVITAGIVIPLIIISDMWLRRYRTTRSHAYITVES